VGRQRLPSISASVFANMIQTRAIVGLCVIVIIADIADPVRRNIIHGIQVEQPFRRIIEADVSHFVKQYVICLISIFTSQHYALSGYSDTNNV